MGKLKKKFGRRILAYILSGAMIMSNMTAFASEAPNDTGGEYVSEVAVDTETDSADNVEESEAEETEKAENDNAAEKDNEKETSVETVEATETETTDDEQTSETESSLSEETETESTEKTTEAETESTEEPSEDAEVSESDIDVKADATIEGWTSIGAVSVEAEKQADGSVVLKSAATKKMGSDNSLTSMLAFGEATDKDITISAKVVVTNIASAANSTGIGIGVEKKTDDTIKSAYVAFRGNSNIKGMAYSTNSSGAVGYNASDLKTESGTTPYKDNNKAELNVEYEMKVVKTSSKVTWSLVGGENSCSNSKSFTADDTKFIQTTDELYPVIIIDGCTATISDLVVEVDGTKVYDMADDGSGDDSGDDVEVTTKTWSFTYGNLPSDLDSTASSNLEYDGLIIDGFQTENGKGHIVAGNGGTVQIPMPRSGIIKLRLYYKASGYIGDDSTKNTFSHNADSRIYPEYYYINDSSESKYVTVTTTGTTFIESIEVTYTGRVGVSGTATVTEEGTIPSDLAVVFTNSKSDDTVEAVLKEGEFTGQLNKGWAYDVAMSDPAYVITAVGNNSFKQDSTTGKWSVTPSKGLANVSLTLEYTETVNVSGKITGLKGDAIDNLELSLKNDEKNYKPSIDIKAVDSDGNYPYEAVLQKGVEYEIIAEGVDEYELQTTTISASADSTDKDIVFEKKTAIPVTIKAVLKSDGTDISDEIKATGAEFKFTDINTKKSYSFVCSSEDEGESKLEFELIPGTYSIEVSNCAPYTQRPTSNLKVEAGVENPVEKIVKFSSEPITKWDFTSSEYTGQLSYKGLTITSGRKHSDRYGLTTSNSQITVPVPGDCTVIVTGSYTWDFKFGEDGEDKQNTGAEKIEEVPYSYEGEKGTVIIYVGNVTATYISKIEIVEKHPYKSTITVGKNKDYTTINDALDAAKKMERTANQRVTIEIDPGDYEEMLVIDTPNITLKNASATPSIKLKNKGVDIDANAVRITSYYGHGYTYYSMGSDSKYDEELLEVNKENGYASFINYGAGTNGQSYWNATVVVDADNFTAEGIIFENSFNQYMSKKAAEDVIEPQEKSDRNQNAGAKEDSSAPRADMEAGDVKVQEKAYVERAAALCIKDGKKNSYFENCSIVGRQDTFVGRPNTTAAFYKCDIFGNTDFICGSSTAVFAKCNLLINTTTDRNDVAYVAVPQTKAGTRGFLMYNCTIDYAKAGQDNATVVDAENNVIRQQAYLGRPWSSGTANAEEALFYKTILEKDDKGKSIIFSEGWKPMSGNESNKMQEYGTIELVKGIDNSGWRAAWASVLNSEVGTDGKVSVKLADDTTVTDDTVISTFLGEWNPFGDNDMEIVEPEKKYDEPDKTFMIALNANDLDAGTWEESRQFGDFMINASAGHEVSVDTLKNTTTGEDAHVQFENYAFSKRLKLGAEGTKDYRSISFDTIGYGSGYLKVIAKSASSDDRELAVWKDGESAPVAKRTVSGARVAEYEFPLKEEGKYYLAATGEGVNIFRVAFYAGTVTDPTTPPTEGEVKLASEILDVSGLTANDNITSDLTSGVFTITADATHAIKVNASAKKYADDNLDFSKRLQFSGKGAAGYRSIKFTIPETITGTGKVTVYALSGSSSEERGLTLHKVDGTVVGAEKMYGGSGDPTKQVYEFTEAGEYYITGDNSACNVYYVKLEYSYTATGGENPPVVTPDPDKPTEDPQHTLWLVGDSTVSAFNDAYYYPRYGYGTQIENYETGYYTVKNLAMSGRSSKSYLTDKDSKPLYEQLTAGISEGDVLIIGFGHNDEKQGEDERYTNPNEDYTVEGSFAKSLYDNYVKLAIDKGATPILCTPIVRRNATGTLTDSNCHIIEDVPGYPGGDYAKAIRELGAAVNVPVVDLTALTKELYTTLGADGTLKLHAWTSDQPGSVDNTHLNIYGAKKVAYMLAKDIQEKNLEGISIHFWTEVEPTEAKDLVFNPNYEPPKYNNNLKQSELWKDYGVFKGTVFGTVGSDMSFYSVGADTDGAMRLKASGNKSKVASGEDGFAMYYYKVPVGKNFSISAKAKLNAIPTGADANQVAFGLMARDDMYIDAVKGVDISTITSDFVVAGSLGADKNGNWTNCFKRKSGKLEKGDNLAEGKIVQGGTYDLNITSNSDGYAVTFDESTIAGGYDFPLTAVDSEYVYIGMFVSRNADVTFTDIKLTVDGVEIDINGSTEPGPGPGPGPTPGPGPDDPTVDPDKPSVDVDIADTTVVTVRVPNVISNGKATEQHSVPVLTWKHDEDGKTVERKLVEGYHYTVEPKEGSDYMTEWTAETPTMQTYVIKAVAGSGFTGQTEGSYKIYGKKSTEVKAASKLTVKLGTKAFDYTGAAITFDDITVSDGKTELTKGTDYDIVFKNNYNAGKGTVIVVGKDVQNETTGVGYIGTKEVDFTIKKVNIKNLTPTYDNIEYKYLGSAVTVSNLEVKLTNADNTTYTLKKGVDYTVTYKANDKPGTANFTIKAMGDNFTGSIAKQTFAIGELKLDDIPADALKTIEYSPKGAKLSTISFELNGNKAVLTEGKDYKVKYVGKAKNVDDEVTATITGKNVDKNATREVTLKVVKADFSKVNVASDSDLIIDTKKWSAKDKQIKVTDYAKAALKLDKDYELTWDTTDGGQAATGLKLTIKPLNAELYTGQKEVEYRVAEKLAKNYTVADKYFNGRTPVAISASDIEGLGTGDFKVVSYKNNAKAGKAGKPVKASVTIEGTGKYYGTATLKFNVYN